MADSPLGIPDNELQEVGGKNTIAGVLQNFGNRLQDELRTSLQSKITTITISHPIAAFFLKMSNECTNFLQGYSIEKMREMRKMLEEAKTDIQELTDGLK